MKKVIDWLKKYWWVVAVIALIITAAIFFWPKKPVVVPESAIPAHKFDSLIYIRTNDSLRTVISALEQEIVKREAYYGRLKAILSKKSDAVQTLPKTKVVEVFSDKIHVDVELREDSNVIVPLQGIRNAVVLIYDGEAAIAGVEYYAGQDSLQRALIDKQKELIGIKDARIVGLTKEFYASQNVIAELKTDLEKQQKKVKRRNTMLGVISGAGAVAILVAVLK